MQSKLFKLKKQQKILEFASNLLETKCENYKKMLMQMCKEGQKMEKNTNQNWQIILASYRQELAFVETESLLKAIKIKTSSNLEVTNKKCCSIELKDINLQISLNYQEDLQPNLADILYEFARHLPQFLKLKVLKSNCEKINQEIKKTVRQTANLNKKKQQINSQILKLETIMNYQNNLNFLRSSLSN